MDLRLPLLLFIPLFLASFSMTVAKNSPKMGICYGQLGDNLLSATRSVKLIKSLKAGRVKIYDTNHKILRALSGTDLQVSVMVPNELIVQVAANKSAADRWVWTQLLPFYPETRVRYLLVGNEILSLPDSPTRRSLVPAIRRIQKSLRVHGLRGIKVGTPVAMDALGSSFPPSNGSFRPDLARPIIVPLLRFLRRTKSFFFVDAYPYFSWAADPDHIALDYALLNPSSVTYTDPVSNLTYTNLLHQMLDAVYSAMDRVGFPDVRLALAETGWPNAGDVEQIGANIHNAATYNRNAVRMFMSRRLGTPARPGALIPAFLFSLYNENQKPGPGTERHFGVSYPNGSLVYGVDLSGGTPDWKFGPLPPPTNDKPYHGKVWCVAVDGANQTALAGAVEWACAHTQRNGTCGPFQKRCYPGGLSGWADFAFSSYWVQFRSLGGSCYFNGLAVQTRRDPSFGNCTIPGVTL